MPSNKKQPRRSSCPINAALEIFGDRWSLLIIRDLMMRGFHTYKELVSSEEGIATNILADRLQRLEAAGIITTSRDAEDRRKVVYRLTGKGIDLAPILVELVLWGARYEASGAPPAMLRKMRTKREQFLAEIRSRWEEGGTATFEEATRPRLKDLLLAAAPRVEVPVTPRRARPRREPPVER